MPRIYTDEQHAWIRDNYPGMTNRELADAFNERFGTDGATPRKMTSYARNHGLRKTEETFRRRNRRYTDEQREWLRGFIPGHSWREISEAYEERFGRRLTKGTIANLKTTLRVRSGTVGGRFNKGRVPSNKGKRWDEFMSPEGQERCRSSQFRRGNVPHNAFHRLLDEKVDGYGSWVYVRPRNRRYPADDWIGEQRFVWMQANGRDWPDGCMAVFADHDRTNMDPDNIVPVPRDLYGIVTTGAHGRALPYHDRESLEVAVTHARVMRERTRLEMRPRRCGVCGREFEPRYPRQRTCRTCLDKGLRSRRGAHGAD